MRHSEKVLFMRIFLSVLVLILSLQSFTKADDISDFEIEGISIGDSLLDYLSRAKIKKAQKKGLNYLDKFYNFWIPIEIKNKDLYERVSVVTKANSDYKIYAISASKKITDNFNDCLKNKENIVKDISELLTTARKVESEKKKHEADKNGKSFTYSTFFWIEKNYIEIACYDMDENNPRNWFDELRVSINHEVFSNFLLEEFYK